MSQQRPRVAGLCAMTVATVVLCVPPQIVGQQADVLTNDKVIQLTQAKLKPSIIVSKIRSSQTNFELSTDELLRLKKAGVADEVLEAMQTAGSYSPVQPTQGGARTERVNQDSPKMPNEPGIYWVGKGGLAQLEPTVYSKQKASGMWKTALTYGIAKTKTKAVVAGRQANMRLSDPAPSFIFCFRQGRDQTALLGYWPGATSANEFILVRMTVSKNSREVQTGEFGAYGASTGVSDDQVRQFRFEKLDAGLYRVWPVSDLEPGEYCFFYGGAVGFLKVFDFSISSNGAL